MEIDRLKTSTTLTDLSSQRLYNVKVVAVYDEGESLPVVAEAVTRKFFLLPFVQLFLYIFYLYVLQCITLLRWRHNFIYLRNILLLALFIIIPGNLR